ncbi:MAG: hypothetical protein KatS3mg087_1498 [Patescibacteria group bacterium]|nr:MAG: hypothetical protein KatS3mg087_1498 [Patescibacteria group bacterium]
MSGTINTQTLRTANLYLAGTQVTASASEINILDGALISTTELNLLSGRTGTLLDSNNVSSYAVTAVIAGSGLTGGTGPGSTTLHVGAGNGIIVSADDITIDADTTGTTSSKSNNSGLEVTTSGLRMLGGCAANEVLAWDAANQVWKCSTVSGIGSLTGTGTDNYLARWNGTNALETSAIYQSDTSYIGIGTTDPTARLDVSGTTWLRGLSANSGLYVNESGYVGIATTNPLYALDVNGNARIQTLGAGSGNEVVTQSSGVLQTRTIDPRVWTGGNLVSGTGVSGQVSFFTGSTAISGSNNLWWDNANSRLGIGTSNPAYSLDVSGTINTQTLRTANLYLAGTQVTASASEINILDGALISTTELNLLSGRTGTLLDSNNVSSYAVTAVIAGSGLTGGTGPGSTTLHVGAGNGIIVSADDITIDADTTGTTSSKSNNSGLEVTTSGLRMLGGCSNGEVLKWNSSTSIWYCAPDTDTQGTATIAGSGVSGQVTFFTGSTAISGSNNLWWNNANSRLGIGFTNPVVSLDVASTVWLRGANANNQGLFVNSSGNVGIATTDPTARLDVSGTTWLRGLSANSGLYVNESGNIGIGTTAPGTSRLVVAGNTNTTQVVIRANSTQSNTNPLIQLQSSSGTPLMSITSDNQTNAFLGVGAGSANTYGSATSGGNNTFIGYLAGSSNTAGYGNTVLGSQALQRNTIGENNIALGYTALGSNISGANNIAIGVRALVYNTTAEGNISIGTNSSYNTTTGGNNITIGMSTLQNNTTGQRNIAIGTSAGNRSETGDGNVFLGYYAGFGSGPTSRTLSNYNIAIGSEAGYSLSNNSSSNIFIGYRAGYNETGSNKLYIDNNSAPAGSAFIYGDMSTDQLTFNANVGIGLTSPAAWIDISGSTTSKASLRIRSGSQPSSPATGDIYNSGTTLYYYNGSSWVDLGTTGTGSIAGSGATNQIAFFTGSTAISGSNNLWWDNANSRLGIGFTNPVVSLDVASTVWLRGANANNQGLFVNSSGNVGIATTDPTARLDVSGTTWLRGLSANSGLYVNESGYVGIATTNPLYALDVNGNARIQTLGAGSGNEVVTQSSGVLQTRTIDPRVWTGGNLVSGTGVSGQVTFFTGSTAISGSNNLWWDNANSRLGIGFTNPVVSLDVASTVWLRGANANNQGLFVNSSGNVGIATTDPTARLDVSGTTWLRGLSANSGLYVNESGNIGIGTTDPGTSRLVVAGNTNTTQVVIRANSTQSNTNPLIQLQSSSGTPLMSITSDNQVNTFIGYGAGAANNYVGGGGNNTFIGYLAGSYNSTGYYNTAIGTNALYSNTTGYDNVAIGYQALYNGDGVTNVAIGSGAYRNNTSGNSSVAIGYQALYYNTSGYINTVIGTQSLYLNTTGMGNVAIGPASGQGNQTGHYNIFIGYRTGYINSRSASNYNIAIGSEAGYSLSNNSSSNIFIGYRAGYNETGSNKLYIDNNSAPAGSAFIYGDMSTDQLTFNANVGIGLTSPAAWIDISGSTTSKASLRIRSGSQPSSPATGDIYNSGTTLYYYNGSSWVDLGTTGTGSIAGSGATNQIAFFTGSTAISGSNNLWWDNANSRLGIGFTNPVVSLDVASTVWLRGANANNQGLFVNSSGNVGIATTDPTARLDVSGTTWLRGLSANSGLYVNESGYVGIATTNPLYALDVNGNARIQTLGAGSGNEVVTQSSGVLQTRTIDPRVWTGGNLVSGTGVSGQVTFFTGSTAISGSNNLWWDNANSRLGIGTSNPAYSLDVSGTTWLRGLSANSGLYVNESGKHWYRNNRSRYIKTSSCWKHKYNTSCDKSKLNTIKYKSFNTASIIIRYSVDVNNVR